MAPLGTKREYPSSNVNGIPFPGEGSQTANSALLRATLALDRMERHEAECGRRWGIVLKLLFLVLTQLFGLLGFLTADKLGWLI